MNLRKIKIISCFAIFLICILIHFTYTIFPNDFFLLFAPVNESIWEHLKMMFSSVLLWCFIEYFILKIYNINCNNLMFNAWFCAFIIIPIFLIMYLPIYHLLKENMIITFIILFISIIIDAWISYKILKSKNNSNLNKLAIILIIITYCIFGYLTYNPIHNYLFYDTMHHKYGLNIYKL